MKDSLGKSQGRFLLFPLAFMGDAVTGLLGIAMPILADSLDATAFELGLIGSSIAVVYSFAPALMGVISDRVGYKRIIISALLLRGTLSLVYPFLMTPLNLVLARILEGFFLSLFWPSLEASIVASHADDVDKSLRRFNIYWALGWIVGPLLAGIFLLVSMKLPFIVGGVLNLAFMVIGIIVLGDLSRAGANERSSDHDRQRRHVDKPLYQDAVGVRFDRFLVMITVLCVHFVIGSLLTFFPVHAVHAGISFFEIGVMVMSFGIARFILFSVMKPTGVEVRGRMIVGGLLSAVATTPFWLLGFGVKSILYGGFVLLGCGSALAYSGSISLMLRGDDKRRGMRSGFFESSIGLGYFLGPFAGGFAASFGSSAVYLLNFIVVGVAVMGYILFQTFKRK